MPDANDIQRAAEALHGVQDQATGALSTGGQGLARGLGGFADFFKHADNLFALTICLVSLVGLYRLLLAEPIIPAAPPRTGGIFSSALAQRLALKIILMVVLAAIGLALFVTRMSGVLESVRQLF